MTVLDIRGFVERVLYLMADDHFDLDYDLMEEFAVKYGLFDERPAAAEDCATDWGQKYDVAVGDPITAKSDALKTWLAEK
jgi:hypothetical protein